MEAKAMIHGVTRFALSFLHVMCRIGQLASVIAGILIVVTATQGHVLWEHMTLYGKSIDQLVQNVGMAGIETGNGLNGADSDMASALLVLVVIAAVYALILILIGLQAFIKLIKNVKAGQFFVADNVHQLRRLVWIEGFDLVGGWVFSLLAAGVTQHYDLSLDLEPLIQLAVTFVIYILMKYGVALQQDADAMI
ncbi:DUF2975 domain-containing protein [Lacticaseibacillus mingshuiensis]|uniref:DUF2975 domain-containing protein n=1 Tax=Lacticaseibacillus mingshuiensis TaxID=2799574 RepID=A0ABW4CKX5_9LACO|nr:DUF2975 domain-containing protein [Lacticaseibacillus mingshuiensis]